jgi:alpha-galactosidase
MKRISLLVVIALLVCPPPTAFSADTAAPPLRVFVLVGQSNMQGKGKIAHLEELIADEKTAADYKHLKHGDGWVERDDVWIKYWDKRGPLTVGYGSPEDRIGPELGFGRVVGEKLKEPVLIIKVAWGGQSLARDFRPPSSGLPSEEKLKEILERTNTNNRKRNQPEVTLDDIKKLYGQRYRDMIAEVRATLADIKNVYPAYQEQGYELSGLVWFQGFNDVINDEFRAEYGENMIHFVRDVRKDLGVKDLPVVIGELGMEGVEVNPRYAHKHYAVRAAQEAPSKMPEFKGTVAFAKTAPLVVMDGKQYDGGYHYRGRADTFYKIGEAFGAAMLPMLSDQPQDNSKQVAAAAK